MMKNRDYNIKEIHEFLEEKTYRYNNSKFIETDPIQVPHQYSKKENIEISGFLTATIAWGQRTTIINNANKLMDLMGNDPYDFLMNADEDDINSVCIVHRTFQTVDCSFFLTSLRNIYLNYGGLGRVFKGFYHKTGDLKEVLNCFRGLFFEMEHQKRTEKHVADVMKGASGKRLNMFLRWMIRDDGKGVDFGLWKEIPSSALFIPLDVHSGNVARKLGLLTRCQNDWKAVEELTTILRQFDPIDPIKYDFALFGTGAFETF